MAVLLGITGSLVIDDNRKETDIQNQINGSLVAIVGELNANIEDLNSLAQFVEKGLPLIDKAIQGDSLHQYDEEQLDRISFVSMTPWGSELQDMVFRSLEASGLIYNIRDDSLRNSILELYENTYERYHFVVDYDVTHIQKLDDIMLTLFVLRDDPESWGWVMDWSDPRNIQQFRENTVFRNHLIANRGNKRLFKAQIPKIRGKTERTIEAIEAYLARH